MGIPFQGTEGGCGLSSPADIASAEKKLGKEDGQGHKASKPEEHGDDLSDQDTEFVSGGGEETRREGEVGNGEDDGPGRAEDEEVDLGGRGGQGGTVVPGRDWRPR